MDREARSAVYAQAISTWGEKHQAMIAVGEMSELTKEICKIFRGKQDLIDLAEEIGDVAIMLEQLCQIYRVGELVEAYMDVKISRLQRRIAAVGGGAAHGEE